MAGVEVVFEAGSHQFWAREGEQIVIPHHPQFSEGEEVTLEKILLVVREDGEEIQVGTPYVEGARIRAKVLQHFRGPKMIVFKKKRRKRYKVKKGHRQWYTLIEVQKIES